MGDKKTKITKTEYMKTKNVRTKNIKNKKYSGDDKYYYYHDKYIDKEINHNIKINLYHTKHCC